MDNKNKKSAALFLAHLNPLTKSHQEIITNLLNEYVVYVYPVIFIKDNREINTKSFPFPYEVRKSMIEAIFNDRNEVKVLPTYSFVSPFIRYLPPFISPYTWKLRNNIIKSFAEKKFISYTGDKIERYLLKIYRLKPVKSQRLAISASKVKENIYNEVKQNKESGKWENQVPDEITKIIRKNWNIIEKFADLEDETIKLAGVKFPSCGFF
ncbi:MAG: hypothetical protein ACPKPY_08645 [Nitrososphaeraceae archaeon]